MENFILRKKKYAEGFAFYSNVFFLRYRLIYKIYEMFLYKYTDTIDYLKKEPTF